MDILFPVTHSKLSTDALLSEVVPEYDVGTPLECGLWHIGLNDTYLVKTNDNQYMLRVYRLGWRSRSEILFELDALMHLEHKGVVVSKPIARKEGGFIRALKAPEGVRYVALFTYAKGKMLSYHNDDTVAYHYGRAVARIHAAMDDFTSPHRRFLLDVDHLIETPLKAIQPLLSHRIEHWHYLQQLAGRLREQIMAYPSDALQRGFCHGDFHGENAHIAEDKTITFFDFDCCGSGWRAYDLAVFRHGARMTNQEMARWGQFIRGYTELRSLNATDLEAVPLFIAIRQIWLMGLHAGNRHHWGLRWINEAYFDHALSFLSQWESEHQLAL